ncbi:DUF29 domain-containing protein [Sphaerospermopsis sp. LEGE 08334]|uniref:DUF29 domain-containing protein n=1 Tax=Sphaerospermopsis sp. LEGE 08334 TaxID=1828651 RepID=UPI00187FC148|nr:DUF29 domain-containing protein [Sphaerospermopsis sp. LEGE 08334]MBE9055545.1 DUF29 domain-containing protein [Sphaerospermopsis sp. LEGE 08334]
MNTLYNSDFYGWTKEQAQLLREEKWEILDKLNLIEEIETLGRQERRELVNRLALLLGHLLKWQYQPEKRSNSWLATIREQRTQVKRILTDSPSLKSYLEEALQLSYEDGINLAVKETNLPYETFPQSCNYTILQILDNEFLPES